MTSEKKQKLCTPIPYGITVDIYLRKLSGPGEIAIYHQTGVVSRPRPESTQDFDRSRVCCVVTDDKQHHIIPIYKVTANLKGRDKKGRPILKFTAYGKLLNKILSYLYTRQLRSIYKHFTKHNIKRRDMEVEKCYGQIFLSTAKRW